MPQREVIAVMEKYRAALLLRERAAATRLVNAYGDVYKRLLPQMDALAAEIKAMEEPKAWQIKKLARLKELKRQIEQEAARFSAVVENIVNEGARQAVGAAEQEARAITQAALPGLLPKVDAAIMGTWNRLPREAIVTLLGFLADDSPLMRMMRQEYAPEVARLFGQQLVEGLALGKNPRVVARQAMGVGLTWALKTARTAHLYAYREAARANYVANSHIVKGWVWRSAKSDRTCLACLAMDGKEFPLDAVLNDHDNGRCFPEPLTASYRDLGLDVDVPAYEVETGRAWFEKQDEQTQRAMMGQAKFDAWKSGALGFDDLVTTHDHPVWGEIRQEASLKAILGEERAEEFK